MTQTTAHTIAIAQVLQIVQGVRRAGVDVEAVLRRAGIAPALLDVPLSRVTQAQYAALMRVLRRVSRDELWGLCQHPLPVGSFAQACRIMQPCRTLGEALHAGLLFYRLVLRDFAPRLQVADGIARIVVASRCERDAPLAYAERSFCFLGYGVMSWLVSRRIELTGVCAPGDSMPYGTEAQRLFLAPLRPDCDFTGLEFDARWLELPVVQSPQSLAEFLGQAPMGLVVRYRGRTRLGERIRHLLRRDLAGELPSLEQVGGALSMTPQTLRRRLRDEGLGFQSLKDDLRRDAAIELLHQPELTLADIAARVGFAEASTFHRAFKGWTGLPPGAYRRAQHRGR
ncbi:MAG: AraC family transcriptional regulator [Burkholderiaceae bacterium]|jgi:AraC-like DNA-binding protein|nr:AraC family transcriptional regulator [Burkholderiaceae bacterium]